MERISLDVSEVARRTDVIGESTDRSASSSDVILTPLSNEADEVVSFILSVKDLREEVKVGDKGSLQDDRDVRGIEQLDGVRYFVTTNLSVSES